LHWIDGLVSALGSTRAVVVLEPDAVAADCFNAARAAELAAATRRLAKAGHFVYLDAGHPRWRSTGEMAERLLESGVSDAEGFSVNVSNRQTTQDSHRWGRELSDLVGNRELIIDTSRNGLGPPPEGQWCNVTKQALGQRPTTRPNMPGVAALLWVKRPGESDGVCGGERTYGFSPRQAERLIENATWVPEPVLAALPGR
jgi:endoglucanase